MRAWTNPLPPEIARGREPRGAMRYEPAATTGISGSTAQLAASARHAQCCKPT
jgi:hypothetical protein